MSDEKHNCPQCGKDYTDAETKWAVVVFENKEGKKRVETVCMQCSNRLRRENGEVLGN